MKLPFEFWLDSVRTTIPADAMQALEEATLAYKVGIYRAAFQFAYTGLLLCLKQRILDGTAPQDYEVGRWNALQSDLRKEHKWEEVLHTEMQNKKSSAFHVDPLLRDEMQFWRNRRNDSAHFKGHSIEAAYVEALWLYMRNTFDKWVVGGSLKDVLGRFDAHFDTRQTPPGRSLESLVQCIERGITDSDVPALVDDLAKSLYSTHRFSLLSELLGSSRNGLQNGLIFALDRRQELSSFLLQYPKHSSRICVLSPERIRSIWTTLPAVSGTFFVLLALLGSGLIPVDQQQEALSRMANNAAVPTSHEESATLNMLGFWPIFEATAIERMTSFS